MKDYPVIDLAATGARIRQLRLKNNLRVEDVSEYMGFESVQAVYKWQRGESLPTVDNLFALSRLFGTSMENILIERGAVTLRKECGGPFSMNYSQNKKDGRRVFLQPGVCGIIVLCPKTY